MRTEDFDYVLPQGLIAQEPAKPRDAARLMVIIRRTGEIFHETFRFLPKYLDKGDCLVANDTKVFPARLRGQKADTKAKVDVLLLRKIFNNHWEALLKPAKRVREGSKITFGDGKLEALVKKKTEAGVSVLKFLSGEDFDEILKEIGEIPLPPYIRKPIGSWDKYQTIYARKEGSVAAPTAGFHFTKEMMAKLKKSGIDLAFITLNVSLDTFRPVRTENIEEHKMQSEDFCIGSRAKEKINRAIMRESRIVAVGTTTARALESAACRIEEREQGCGRRCIEEQQGRTDLFIYSGFKFIIIDALITNFHLPKSTLLMLVSAFAGRELILKAYKEAIREKYRFYSFGDCMIIL